MDDITKEKIKNLIHLRTNIFTVLIVLSSGMASILLLDKITIPIWIALIIGARFWWTFLDNILSINKKLENLTKETK